MNYYRTYTLCSVYKFGILDPKFCIQTLKYDLEKQPLNCSLCFFLDKKSQTFDFFAVYYRGI